MESEVWGLGSGVRTPLYDGMKLQDYPGERLVNVPVHRLQEILSSWYQGAQSLRCCRIIAYMQTIVTLLIPRRIAGDTVFYQSAYEVMTAY